MMVIIVCFVICIMILYTQRRIERFNPELEYLYKMREGISVEDIEINALCKKVDPMMYLAETSNVLPPRWKIKTYEKHELPYYVTDKCQNKYLSCIKNAC